MKQLLILIILFPLTIYAQDNEPPAWDFQWGYSETFRPFNPDSMKQTSVLTGFQWGGSWQMNNALENNVSTGGKYTGPGGPINRKLNMILQPTWGNGNFYLPGYFFAPFMQYEPTLPLDGTNEGTILRPDDTSDPVFGFRNRKGTISTNPLDENYSRIVLKKDSSYVDDIVLSDIWPQPNFRTRTHHEYAKGGKTDNYSGHKWYLTVNLKRLNPLTDNAINDSIILRIKVPFQRWNQNIDTIKFNKLPINHQDSTENFDDLAFGDRGNYQKLGTVTATKSFDITNRMIPIDIDSSNITISAEFITNDNTFIYNSEFSKKSNDSTKIKDLDIQVQYLGNLDIAIDWIKIEGPNARILTSGQVDYKVDTTNGPGVRWFNTQDVDSGWIDGQYVSLLEPINSIYTTIQTAIDDMKIESNNWEYASLFRLNFQDTENDSYYWWGPLRYCNKFANGMFMTRDGLQNTKLYYYYTHSPNKWIGVGLGSDYAVPAPYARNGTDNIYSFGIKTGFRRHLGGNTIPDTLNSQYETMMKGLGGFTYEWESLKNDTFYTYQLEHNEVLQARYEGGIVGRYFEEPKNSFLYSDNPWYFYNLIYNVGVHAFVIGDRDSNAKFGYYRAKTAEEFRLMNMGALIKGCKGFISDGDQNHKFPDVGIDSPGIGDHTLLNENNDIYSDSVGTDFINAKYNTWNIWEYINLEVVAANQQVDTSRIYIGTKSMRSELFEFNSFVRANDDLLMNLSLSAAMSKGYRKHYTQNDEIFGSIDTILKSFIDLDETITYTSKLPNSTSNIIQPEPYDSSFFELTLLSEQDKPIDSVFYIGVLNRRTDPLIHYIDPITNDSLMRFLSSSEFLDSCENSTDTALYRSYWWKRQGARRLTIPFNYTYSDGSDYKLLRISEIGSNVDSLNSLIHRDPKYYDMVTDTVIGQDKSLSFNLLPGQAKILKVQVLKPDIVEGFLDNYNQNNLVEYRDPLDSNMIVYHLAFYKNSKKPDDTSKVYKEVHYIRSYPIRRNSFNENIIWDSNSRVNLSRLFFESLPTIPTKYDDCNHPALVVREDSSGLPHPYIVYTCKDSAVTGSGEGRVILAKVSPFGGSYDYNNEISKLSFNDIERFGTPTINASADGNYIAWTDSLRGILIAYQKKIDDSIADIDTIKKHEFSNVAPGSILFPSFNTYSHIDNGENNAGLVWYQENQSQGGIYYSRVSFDAQADTVVLNIPDNYEGDSYLRKDIYSKMMRVSLLSFDNDYNTKPIIYRSLGSYDVSGVPWCLYNRYDNINWIDYYSSPGFSNTHIFGTTLYHRDNNHINQSWSSSKANEISFSGLQKDIIVNSINSAQQDGIILDETEIEAGGNFNLNFTLDSAVIYQVPGVNGSNFLRRGTSSYEGSYPMVSPRRASYGDMVQLAKSKKPNFEENYDMWKNRRIFESDEQDTLGNPIIKSSAHLFYKAAYTETMDNHVFYGFTGDSNNVYFDLPKFEGDPGSISSFPIEFDTYPNRYDPCFPYLLADETQASFILPGLILKDANSDGEKEMEISIYGNKNSDISVILERAYDSAQVVLTMPPITTYPVGATKLIYSILDSTTSEFNLIFQNNDSTAIYNEKAFIGGLANTDTISYKSAIKKDPVKYIIDFNNGGIQYEAKNINDFDLTVYPNPTSGNLRVQAFLPEKLDGYKIENRSLVVSVYDATGRLVTSQNGATGQMFDFDLTNLPSGAYIINVEHAEGNKKYTARERIVKE